jgi:hypothetical protein
MSYLKQKMIVDLIMIELNSRLQLFEPIVYSQSKSPRLFAKLQG